MPADGGFHPTRGELVDIGGRRMRVVRAGGASGTPLVVLESGSYGFSPDWAVVQERLAAKGFRSLAYDRAGLGYSDPGPKPRDGLAVVQDLERLLAAAGERGPFVLVGHSMAGLWVRLFLGRNPRDVAGLVLVDAATPEAMDMPVVRRFVGGYMDVSRLYKVTAQVGLSRPIAPLIGDRIGLSGEAAAEKRRAYVTPSHIAWASEEIQRWPDAARQARESGAIDPAIPVAVVTAGAFRGGKGWQSWQAAPARASRAGYIDHVAGADHASLLGRRFADPIVKGIEHVMAHRAPASPAPSPRGTGPGPAAAPPAD
jgi:pimeloyl-ACP methyl ester carboxylesterase